MIEIRSAVKSRGISCLVHFTRFENLDSILTNGIIPRGILESSNMIFSYNDDVRIDGYKNANCLSISFPNYRMFYSLRMQNPNQEWVIIGVKPEVLWLKNCAFCHENAASNAVTNIQIQDRIGINAFNRMFDNVYGKPDRSAINLPSSFPTNPQAEVLVFDKIEPSYIFGVACYSEYIRSFLKVNYPNFDFYHKKDLYSYRADYRHWQNGN